MGALCGARSGLEGSYRVKHYSSIVSKILRAAEADYILLKQRCCRAFFGSLVMHPIAG